MEDNFWARIKSDENAEGSETVSGVLARKGSLEELLGTEDFLNECLAMDEKTQTSESLIAIFCESENVIKILHFLLSIPEAADTTELELSSRHSSLCHELLSMRPPNLIRTIASSTEDDGYVYLKMIFESLDDIHKHANFDFNIFYCNANLKPLDFCKNSETLVKKQHSEAKNDSDEDGLRAQKSQMAFKRYNYFKTLIISINEMERAEFMKFVASMGDGIVFDYLLRNIGNASILEALVQIGWKGTSKLDQIWLLKAKTIKKLIRKLFEGTEDETKNVSECFKSLIIDCFFVSTKTFRTDLFLDFNKKENIEEIIKGCLECKESTFVDSLKVLIVLSGRTAEFIMNEQKTLGSVVFLENPAAGEHIEWGENTELDDENTFIVSDVFCENLHHFKALFEVNPSEYYFEKKKEITENKKNLDKKINVPTKMEELKPKKFGKIRQKILELLFCLLQLDKENLNAKIDDLGLLVEMLKHILLSPLNPHLQNLVLEVITIVAKGGSLRLKRSLIEKGKVVDMLCRCVGILEPEEKAKTKNSAENLNGIAFSIGEFLARESERNRTLKLLLEKNNLWKKFIKEFLEVKCKSMAHVIGEKSFRTVLSTQIEIQSKTNVEV